MKRPVNPPLPAHVPPPKLILLPVPRLVMGRESPRFLVHLDVGIPDRNDTAGPRS